MPARTDRWNNAAVEAAMLSLASRCRIRVPELRIEQLGGESTLMLRRFDREKVAGGYLRHRPDADTFPPPLDGYTTEEVDAGELEESLARPRP